MAKKTAAPEPAGVTVTIPPSPPDDAAKPAPPTTDGGMADEPAFNLRILDQSVQGGVYVVTVQASNRDGDVDTDVGAVALSPSLDQRAADIMRAVTLAKRRVRASILGRPIPVEEVPLIPDTPPAPTVTTLPLCAPLPPTPPAAPAPVAEPEPTPAPPTVGPSAEATLRVEVLAQIGELTKALKIPPTATDAKLREYYGVATFGDMTADQLVDFHKRLCQLRDKLAKK